MIRCGLLIRELESLAPRLRFEGRSGSVAVRILRGVCDCDAIDLLLLDSALTADHLVVFARLLIVWAMCRWLHTPAFATVSPEEISGSSPAEVQNFGKMTIIWGDLLVRVSLVWLCLYYVKFENCVSRGDY
jgi:hypothetical protein